MDLIERLIDEADGYGDGPVVLHDIEGLRALLREAAAALEAAREDAGLWRQAFVNERARINREHGMSIEQARIHAETDAEIAAIDQARGKGVDGG